MLTLDYVEPFKGTRYSIICYTCKDSGRFRKRKQTGEFCIFFSKLPLASKSECDETEQEQGKNIGNKNNTHEACLKEVWSPKYSPMTHIGLEWHGFPVWQDQDDAGHWGEKAGLVKAFPTYNFHPMSLKVFAATSHVLNALTDLVTGLRNVRTGLEKANEANEGKHTDRLLE